ncbi:ribosome-binding factor A [Flavonifractor plautii]|nr:ribosome-binding factor A [Flavonifractor plautii]
MPSNRIGRINEEIQRELAALIRTVKDPGCTAWCPSRRWIPPGSPLRENLRQRAGQERREGGRQGPEVRRGYLRRELGRALPLRYTPELQFVEDDSIDTGAHILSMLRNPEVVKPANPANAHIELDGEE